jgi:DNA-binding transcriptional ArsR family regulator
MDRDQLERLSTLFKALADPMRLQILGLLAARPRAGHELAQETGLTPPTISHHMRRLLDAGLVDFQSEAQSRIYALRIDPLRDLTLNTKEHSEPRTGEEPDDRVIRAFFDGPRLRQMPASRKKRVAVLRHLLLRFEPGQEYPEPQVNDLLRVAHDDVATLRRELVDYGFMTRERGIYRVATQLPERGATVSQEVGNEAQWFRDLVTRATVSATSTESEARAGCRGVVRNAILAG